MKENKTFGYLRKFYLIGRKVKQILSKVVQSCDFLCLVIFCIELPIILIVLCLKLNKISVTDNTLSRFLKL